MRSAGHIGVILLILTATILAVVGGREIPGLSAFVGVAGAVTLCVIVIIPFALIDRARQISLIVRKEEEPFWLAGGSIALSNLSISPPAGAKWWWKDRVALVFLRHLTVRFSFDAFTGDMIWENPALSSDFLSANRATQILKDLLSRSHYRQMVSPSRASPHWRANSHSCSP